jgi:hypothetical protein
MPPHGGRIIPICHSDATAVSAGRAMNSCSLWLAKTCRDEETYRPRYGSPVDVDRNETPYS